MNYQGIRSDIKSGDVLAFTYDKWATPKDWVAQLIRICTRSEYFHVGIAWVVGDRVMIIEAVYPEVKIHTLSLKGDFFWIPMDLNWTPEVEKKALSFVGQKYSILQAVVSVFMIPEDDDRWQCSELVIKVLKEVGIELPYTPTPEHVVKALREMGKPIYFVRN